jgi:hypothetical protein
VTNLDAIGEPTFDPEAENDEICDVGMTDPAAPVTKAGRDLFERRQVHMPYCGVFVWAEMPQQVMAPACGCNLAEAISAIEAEAAQAAEQRVEVLREALLVSADALDAVGDDGAVRITTSAIAATMRDVALDTEAGK